MKRFFSIILTICMVFSIIPFGVLSASAGVGDYRMTEVEPNSSMSVADRVYNDYTVSGLVSGVDMDYYKFTLSSRSTVSIITVGRYKSCFMSGVFNTSEEAVAASYFEEYSSNGYPTYLLTATLNAGTYYFVLFNRDASTLSNYYSFYITYSAVSHTHTYTNSCDTSCNTCGETRSATHTYSNSCDTSCNVCGAIRSTSHTYSDDCDTSCNICGFARVTTHKYDTDCDIDCNVCGLVRVTTHKYSADCATKCTVCGDTREAEILHTYIDDCDDSCEICGETRIVSHFYENSCDTDCAECGAIRAIEHTYDNNCDAECNVCGFTRTISHTYGAGKVSVAATCNKTGSKLYTCEVCGATKTETINKTNTHTYKNTITKATMTKDGKITSTCSVCKKTVTSRICYPKTIQLSTTSYTYNGGVKTPTVIVKNSAGDTLKQGTHYTVSYAKGRANVGTYKVVVTMIGNYRSGSKTLTFKINPRTITNGEFSLSAANYTYDGKVKTPTETVKNSSGTKLTRNIHYTVAYASGRKNVGTYKITIKGKGNYTGTKVLTFNIKPTTKTTVNMLVGATSNIGAKSNKAITYSSSNKNIVTVNSKGVLTAKGAGTATITVKSNGITQKITVKVVKPYVKVTGSNSVYVKGAITLKGETNTGAKITWSSSNTKVATVSSAGKVTGVKAGTATIYAKVTYKGKTYTAKYNVTVKTPSIALNKTSLTLNLGSSYTLTATANPKVTVTYKSSNKNVATVSSAGKIVACNTGTANITASITYGGKTYSKVCTVKVTARDYSKVVLYEDSAVKITFKSAEKYKYADNEVILSFVVKNKLKKTLLIQADAVSLNGYTFNNLTMSDEVAGSSTGVVTMSVSEFDFNLVSNIYSINSIGGQFRIIDDATWDSYDAIFTNVRMDGKGVAAKPTFNKGTLVYSDSNCNIYYKNATMSKYDSTGAELYFYVENKTKKTLLIQADVVSINGYSYSDLIMSDPVLAQSVGTVNVTLYNYYSSSINPKTLGAQLKIIDDATWSSYKANFSNKTVK